MIVGGCDRTVNASENRDYVAVIVDAKALVAVFAQILLKAVKVQATASEPCVTQIVC